MSALFCCSSINPYRPRRLDHEAEFTAFSRWSGIHKSSPALNDSSAVINTAPYAIQLVRQINHRSLESVRYFVTASNGLDFIELNGDDLIEANFEKVNSYLTT